MATTRTASQTRYSTGAMIFHWLIAVLVIMNWQIAERAHELDGALRGEVMNYHKAWGITILVLTIGRILWRLTHKRPPLASHLAGWEKMLAKLTHFLFYALLIGLPLGGWLANSFAGREIDFFGLFTIGGLPVGENRDMAEQIFEAHHTGGKFLLILVGLHVLGVVKHMVMDRDGQLWRMLPWGTPKS